MPPNDNKNKYEEFNFDEFKETLGYKANSMSDTQIKDLYEMECQLADILLNKWLGEENATQELYN